MSRKQRHKPDDPAESRRFIEVAHEAQADEADKESFMRAVKKVALSPKRAIKKQES